ncbi:MAG: hypothetical protein KF817_05690 [Phycisphaeraceae bacterium]|nr:hypothetical protein [Phycisphaeraceae bacterium]
MLQSTHHRRTASALIALASLLAACESTEKILPPVVAQTPLSLDPTDAWEVVRWWSNGSEMIRFDENGAYALFGSMNRYHAPIEVGRWSKESYARLQLEPYQARRVEYVRVGAERLDGRIALRRPPLAPFFAISRPPVVAEDALVGRWLGDAVEIDIRPDGRFRIARRVVEASALTAIARHEGAWRLDGTRLLLEPDGLGIERLVVDVAEDEDGLRLQLGPALLVQQPTEP